MQTTRTTAVAIGLAAICAAGLTAQTQETKTTIKTKIEMKGGKNLTAIGCLACRENGDYIFHDGSGRAPQCPVVRACHRPRSVQSRGRARP